MSMREQVNEAAGSGAAEERRAPLVRSGEPKVRGAHRRDARSAAQDGSHGEPDPQRSNGRLPGERTAMLASHSMSPRLFEVWRQSGLQHRN